MLNNSIHGRMDDLQSEIDSIRTDLGVSRSEIRDNMDTFRSQIHDDMNTFRSSIRDEINIIRSYIKELQSRTSSIEGKLELLIDAWGIAKPSPPAIAKK